MAVAAQSDTIEAQKAGTLRYLWLPKQTDPDPILFASQLTLIDLFFEVAYVFGKIAKKHAQLCCRKWDPRYVLFSTPFNCRGTAHNTEALSHRTHQQLWR